jgi:type IV pilus assembly protein PilM
LAGKNLVGVDIGSAAIKVAHLRETKKGHHLLNFAMEPLPPQTIVDGNVMNSGAVIDALQKMWKTNRIKSKDVSLSISGHSVIIKKIPVPLMTDDELEEQIHWEAEQHIPFDINDVEIDYEVLTRRDDQGQMDILLVAAKKDEINDYAQVARESRLRPLVVDIDAFALQNCYELNYGFEPSETVALLNVGASLTTINIVQGGVTMFTRDMASGGNGITEEIQKQLGVSFEEAEAYKTGGTLGEESTEVVPEEIHGIVRQVVESLAGEIQRSLDFYLATSAGGDVDRIFVVGGTSRLRSLIQSIEDRAHVPVESLDPFRRITIDERTVDPQVLRDAGPQAAVCLGLALRKDKERR